MILVKRFLVPGILDITYDPQEDPQILWYALKFVNFNICIPEVACINDM